MPESDVSWAYAVLCLSQKDQRLLIDREWVQLGINVQLKAVGRGRQRIQPQAVRLQQAPEDGYTWSVTDSKAHLMKTSLSSGTVGLYDAICKEIGWLIKAVRPSRAPGAILDSDPTQLSSASGEEDSFTTIIERLRRENHQLQEEIGDLRDHIETISQVSRDRERRSWQLEKDIIREQNLIRELKAELSNVRSGVGDAIRLLVQHQDCQANRKVVRLMTLIRIACTT
ncbi:hypothetical protein CNMCM6936_005381 [Aspergillus lentulus]|nr:hypothetical protein CNMCM6936_005381 [Aspergillus lentulus]